MTEPLDGYVLESPGVMRSLAWPHEEVLEAAPAAALVARIVAAFEPLLRPLSLDVLLRAYHPETQEPVELAHPFWFVAARAAEAALAVAPSTGRSEQLTVEALTPAAVETSIMEVFARARPTAEAIVVLDEIRVYALEVRVPAEYADRATLTFGDPTAQLTVEVEHRGDGAWVRSPRTPAEPLPFALLMTGWFAKLSITTYWSLWIPGGPGEPAVTAVIDALVASGWLRVP